MRGFPRTLWDLLPGRTPEREPATAPRPAPQREPATAPRPARQRAAPTMQDRYDALVVEMKRTYRVRVHRWRTSTSGCAWEVHGHDGSISRLIEAPRPKGPMSCAVFMHEIGHHAIGFGRYRPRCLEEYHAWRWALEGMRERDFNVTPAVERRMFDALVYAVAKARRRGLRRLPVELVPYLPADALASSDQAPAPAPEI